MDHERLALTRAALADAQLDVLVCRMPEHVVMLSGHWPLIGWSFLLFPASGRATLIAPRCDESVAAATLWEADLVTYGFGLLGDEDPLTAIAARLRQAAAGKAWRRVGYEGAFEVVAPPWNASEPAVSAGPSAAMLADVFGRQALVDATPVLHALRLYKTLPERANLRRANEIAALGLRAFSARVAPGVRGIDLVAAVESAVLCEGTGYQGARCVRAFAQVTTGAAETSVANRPMMVSSARPMADGDLALLELGVVVDGVWADRTRTRVAGTPTLLQQEVFALVLRAQETAIAAVRPGVTAGTLDECARSPIRAAGYGAAFAHHTGHSLGYRYHEPGLQLLPGNPTPLLPGMVLTIEPGIYLPAMGGIRIEDDLLVTDTGHEVLGPAPKDLC